MQEVNSTLLYRDYTAASIFPFISDEEGLKIVFIKDTITNKLSDIRGTPVKCDISIVFTAAKALLRGTYGLFTPQNVLKKVPEKFQPLLVSKPENYNCNMIYNEPAFVELLDAFLKTSIQFELPTGVKAFALPLANVPLEECNAFLKENGHSVEISLVSVEELVSLKDENFEEWTIEAIRLLKIGLIPSITKKISTVPAKRYAIVNCRELLENQSGLACLYTFGEAALQGHFRKPGEEWYLFKAAHGELPDPELLKTLDGIIIPGAPGHCYDPIHKWIPEVEKLIRHVYENTNIRYLGLCYGAQLLAQALGGKVEKMSHMATRLGNDEVILKEEFYELPYVRAYKEFYAKKPKSLAYLKSHGDHITKLPREAKLLGSSQTTEVEIFTMGDRFFAVQGHPEATAEFACARISLTKLSEADDEAIAAYEKAKAERIKERYAIPEDKFAFLAILTNFLKGIEN